MAEIDFIVPVDEVIIPRGGGVTCIFTSRHFHFRKVIVVANLECAVTATDRTCCKRIVAAPSPAVR